MWAAGNGNLDSTPQLTPNIAGILGPFSSSDSSGYPAPASAVLSHSAMFDSL